MDLRQLAAIAAVAEAGSFSAAARHLHTVQSNVSTHIARLERELGTTLVDRTTGSLTDEGEVVVDRARRVQHELESLRADVDSMLHDVSGEVRLGCIGTVSRWLVPNLLRLMASRHPLVRVVVVDATTTSLVPQVVNKSLDLAVVNLPLADAELATEPLFDEDRVLVAPHGRARSHRRAGRVRRTGRRPSERARPSGRSRSSRDGYTLDPRVERIRTTGDDRQGVRGCAREHHDHRQPH